jgi:hypothetical protein
VSADQSGFEQGRGDEPDEDARFADLPRVRVRVPDDARDLAPDVRAYHRELRRRHDEGAAPPPRASDPSDTVRPGRMIVGVLALLLIVAGLAMMVSPRRDFVARTPLATNALASTEPGAPGTFLPEVIVVVDRAEHALRDLRPAVIALVPPNCPCERDLATLFSEAGQYGLKVYLTPGSMRPSLTRPGTGADPFVELNRMVKAFASSRVSLLQDPGEALVSAYRPQELTLLLVAADGVVAEVRHGASVLTALELGLARLSHPTDPSSSTTAESEPTRT